MKLKLLKNLRKLFLSMALWCSRESKIIVAKKNQADKDRLLELAFKDNLTNKEKKELEALLNKDNDDIIIL